MFAQSQTAKSPLALAYLTMITTQIAHDSLWMRRGLPRQVEWLACTPMKRFDLCQHFRCLGNQARITKGQHGREGFFFLATNFTPNLGRTAHGINLSNTMHYICFGLHPTYNCPMENFKSLFQLSADITYLNHGAYGSTPIPVLTYYQDLQRQLEENPTEFFLKRFYIHENKTRQALSLYLHAPMDHILLLPNVTHAINLVAKSLQFNPNDEILLSDHEYGACEIIWNYIQRKTGARLVLAKIPLPIQSDEAIIESLWHHVTERTRLIFLSHITSPTALRFPIGPICQRAREEGIVTLIDGAHAPGQIDLDLQALQADFYTGNCHKWMLAPKGAAFLYVHPNMQEALTPLVISWGYGEHTDISTGSKFVDQFAWRGTEDPSAIFSIPAAIEFMRQHHWEEVRLQCHQLALEFIHLAGSRLGLIPLCPQNLIAQMVSMRLPVETDTKRLQQYLMEEENIFVPILDWKGTKLIRVSYQAYNSDADTYRLVDALEKSLPRFRKK